jgi:cytochrome c-type biogenesis protein CcmF
MILIGLTYFLVILGTFTTRSGIIESVHSFARSDVGPFFLGFMIIILFGFTWLLFQRMPLLKDDQPIDSYASREAAFMANNWVFTALAFATLWGTFFPMFSEIFTGDRISVAAPFFNKVNGPLFLILLVLMGAGPLLGWRHTTLDSFRKQFTWPLIAAAAAAVGVLIFSRSIFPIIGIAVCAFVTATIVQEFVRGVLARRAANQENVVVAVASLFGRNGRRYGGYLVHLGIVMLGVAIIGNEFYQTTTNVTLARGESVTLSGYELVFTGLNAREEGNRVAYITPIMIYGADSGRLLGQVEPHRNIYAKNPEMPTSEVGLRSTLVEDVYVVLNGWEQGGEMATFTIYVNPLTMWMWLGGLVLVIGTLIAIWPHPQRRQVEASAALAYGGARA